MVCSTERFQAYHCEAGVPCEPYMPADEDMDCPGRWHAVPAVGCSPAGRYILVKNSGGVGWGESGIGKYSVLGHPEAEQPILYWPPWPVIVPRAE